MNLGIIDDDANILYTVRAMAASIGYPIKTTSDPDECLGWVRDDAVDILLVDYHMPRMSGLEVVRRARQLSQKLIILVLTIEERSEVAKELLVAGMRRRVVRHSGLGEALRQKQVDRAGIDRLQKEFRTRIGKDSYAKLTNQEEKEFKTETEAYKSAEEGKYRQEAREHYQRLVESYPRSKWAKRARHELEGMGKG